MFNRPHQPAGGDRTKNKKSETEQAEADHKAGFRALGDPKND